MPQERRTLTVLFADLKGFTALSEDADPEDIHEIVSALFERFRSSIESEGGVVDKYMGDAVMAVWGAARANEDDPLRAVRAAHEMQQEVERFNGERGVGLSLRAGINTGEALWGEIAGDRPTAMGDAVNLAQRLEQACTPGRVLVSSAVERATRSFVHYRELEPISVKGRVESVRSFEVEALGERREAILTTSRS